MTLAKKTPEKHQLILRHTIENLARDCKKSGGGTKLVERTEMKRAVLVMVDNCAKKTLPWRWLLMLVEGRNYPD